MRYDINPYTRLRWGDIPRVKVCFDVPGKPLRHFAPACFAGLRKNRRAVTYGVPKISSSIITQGKSHDKLNKQKTNSCADMQILENGVFQLSLF